MKGLAAWLLGALVALTPAAALAGQERYDYDGLGRLIRVIDEQGRVTEYVYDAAGNLLRVITGGSAQAPAVTSSSPASIRRGETKAVQIIGTGLSGAHVSTADAGLEVSNLRATATQIDFNLTASTSAGLGARTIAVSNSAGSTSISLTVNPVLPKLGMSPQPIAVPPTNTARSFFVSLSSADNIPHTVNLASANTAIASVSPASIAIPAGQTEMIVSVTGKAAGNTSINLTSPDLPGTSVPVFVTAEFSGITTSFAPLVGVVLTPSAPAIVSTTFTPIASPVLGVAKGAYIQGIAPNRFAIGTGPANMVIAGNDLAGVTGVTIAPPDGVTLGAPSPAADGRSVTVPITVAANAPVSERTVLLSGAQQPYAAARAGADHILITLPAPQVTAVDPNFAVAGATAMTFTVRGTNLQGAQGVTFTPSAGISVSSTPSASADGTAVTLSISVSALAATGARVVTIATPGGASDAAASPANTFSVVNEVQASFTPIVAPIVGVVKQETPAPQSQTFSAFSAHLGVLVPPGLSGMSPAVGIIGQTITLTLSGAGLAGVTSVQAIPPDGLTLGALSVSPDGTTVTVPVDVAATAPQTLRTIRVLAGGANIAFANPNSALFRVTAPLPQIDGISQIYLQVGAPAVSLTLFGRNFQNASAVRVDPPGGMTVSPPATNADATQASVTISAAALAATGPRTVIIATPPGESAVTASPANTLTLVNTIQSNFTPILAPAVGVVLQSVAAPVSTTFGPFVSPNLGVVLQAGSPPPASSQLFAFGTPLGVVTGAFATGVQAPPLTPNASATLTISGAGLVDASAVQVSPPDNVTVGTLNIAPDGSQIQAPIALAGAAAGPRTVIVMRGAQRVSFVPAGSDIIRIAAGAPNIDSLSPILASRGQSFTMTIRGQNLQGVTRVAATPGTGIFIDSSPVVNGSGDIVLQVSIAADAPLGSSVFRAFTPGGATSDVAAPANTFTVLE